MHLIIEQGKYKSKYHTGPCEHALLLRINQNKDVSTSKESPQAMLACLRACVTTAWLPAEEGKHIGRWAGDCENATSSSVRLGASRKEGLQFYCACASSACRRKDGAQHREKMSPQWSLDALLHTASALSSSISCIPVCFEGLLSFTGQRFQEHLHT